jgi:hypothetical protein
MYTLALHIEECQCYMSSPKQHPLTCLRGSTSLQAKANATEKERVICANLRSQGNHLWTWYEIQRQLGICCATCQLSLRVPQRRQGYQTTSESALAHRPGVTRAARTQKYRAVHDEKAAPAFSRW